MKTSFSLCLIVIAFWISSCSKAIVGNNPASPNTTEAPEPERSRPASTQSAETVESRTSSNPRDAVLFDGKDYIKKSGWNVPSKNETYVEKRETQIERTQNGKEVKVTSIHYIYKSPRFYSEDFTLTVGISIP